MAAATVVATPAAMNTVFGNKRIATITLTIANTNTWDTGLRRIDAAFASNNDTQDATDTISMAYSDGTITFTVANTITPVSVIAIGE